MIAIFKALGDESRLRMINLLLKSSLCVCELETILGMSQSNVSRHLAKLKNAGLISSYKDQQWVYYQISDEFRDSGSELIVYMIKNLKNEELFSKDDVVYKKYRENNFDCNSISDDKLVVIDLIYQEGK